MQFFFYGICWGHTECKYGSGVTHGIAIGCLCQRFGKVRNEKAAQRVSFGAGYPADVHADIPADVRGQELRSGPRKAGKNKHFGADIHDPKARTSMTARVFFLLRSEKTSG